MPREAKRSITIAGHRTSLSLEPEFWTALKTMAKRDGRPLANLVAEIDGARAREAGTLSSALRVYVLKRLQQRA